MRLAAAILATVMSVTTGGPLRCPCHLLALLRTGPSTVVAPPAAEQEASGGCGCRVHREPQPEPTDQRPRPHRPPCPHGPGVDLLPPLSTGERVVGGHDSGDPVVTLPGHGYAPTTASSYDSAVSAHVTPAASPPDRLRYCHAFRC